MIKGPVSRIKVWIDFGDDEAGASCTRDVEDVEDVEDGGVLVEGFSAVRGVSAGNCAASDEYVAAI